MCYKSGVGFLEYDGSPTSLIIVTLHIHTHIHLPQNKIKKKDLKDFLSYKMRMNMYIYVCDKARSEDIFGKLILKFAYARHESIFMYNKRYANPILCLEKKGVKKIVQLKF